jgi:hypothetical protein
MNMSFASLACNMLLSSNESLGINDKSMAFAAS